MLEKMLYEEKRKLAYDIAMLWMKKRNPSNAVEHVKAFAEAYDAVSAELLLPENS